MIGIVNDEDFEKEIEDLSKPTPETKPCVIIDIARGRGSKPETPESLRKIIGDTALEGSSPQAIAEAFHISPSSISAYKVGATSTASYNKPNKELKDHTDKTRQQITKRASRRIMSAMKHITEDKIANAKLKDISGIAKDMSAVIKNIQPKDNNGMNVTATQYLIYAPRIKKEDEFEVVEAVNE